MKQFALMTVAVLLIAAAPAYYAYQAQDRDAVPAAQSAQSWQKPSYILP